MTDKIVTAEEMRHYDSYTINTIGIPSLVLMERAALAVRDEILHAFPIALKDVVVVAGSGPFCGLCRPVGKGYRGWNSHCTLASYCWCPCNDPQYR